MNTGTQPSDIEVDVLVVGGGPAGTTAALAAARNGARVALVERYGFLGGNATAGLVGNFCGFYASGEKAERIVGGIAWEIVQAMVKQHAAMESLEDVNNKGIWSVPFNHEILKSVLDRMVLQENIVPLFHTLAVETIVDGRDVKAVIVENKSGRQSIFARAIIDATGDGDIAARAGAEYETAKHPQAMTTMFSMANVDVDRAMAMRPEMPRLMKEATEQGRFPLPRYEGGIVLTPGMPGVVVANMTRITDAVGTDTADLTRAEIEGRRQALLYADFLRQCVSGFERAFLVSTAAQVGVRETRRIKGEYVLTENDVLEARRFDDVIGRNAWPVEIHESGAGGKVHWQRLPDGQSYDIPYRCLIPRTVENLLVAGRCASTTHVAHASTRVTGPCMVMGQAAGTAAAIAVKHNITPRQVDSSLLQIAGTDRRQCL